MKVKRIIGGAKLNTDRSIAESDPPNGKIFSPCGKNRPAGLRIHKWAVVLIGVLLELTGSAWAQDYPIGIRAQALGGAGVAKGRDAESLYQNPALLTEVPGAALTAFYSQPFGLKELRLSSLAGSAQWKRFSFGAALVDFGNDLFRDRMLHLALARSFLPAERLGIGISAAVRQLRISGYGEDSAILFNFGTQLRLSESLAWGTALTNLFEAEIGRKQEKLPRSVCIGFSYSPTAIVTLQMDLYKQSQFPQEWRVGIEVNPLPILLLRTGIGSNPDRLTFGFALRLLKVSLQFAAFSHTDLGWTQQYAVAVRSVSERK
jgi:hypothetical protein